MAELVTKVWIEPGCIVCDACETASPEVFEVQDETCVIRPAALNADFTKPRTESIIEAAEECPVDVIKYETVAGEAPAAEGGEPAPAKAESEPATAEASQSPEPAAAAAPAAEPAQAAAAKAPDKPAPAKQPDKAKAPNEPKPKADPKVSVAGDPDPAIQALLRAATSRGGRAQIARTEAGSPAARDWEKKPASELPPDARTAKVLKSRPDSDGVSRRGVLAGSAVGIGWLAFGGASAVSALAFQRFMMPNVLEEPDPRVRAGKIELYASMAPGEVNEDFKPQGFWIIRTEDAIAALNIICTHLGCIPNWLPNDRKFKCPCHGSGFKQNGINFEGPAPRPLERFRVSLKDGVLLVDRSKKFQYEKGEWENPESYIAV